MLLDTPLCDFGWDAPDFTLIDPHDRAYTMSEEMGENGLLIAFICNHCPYVKAIISRFVEDAKDLKKLGVNVLAVMPNDYHSYPDDAPDQMLAFAKEHSFPFPYLIDADQQVARDYDAICTPDFFGLNAEGELQYRGRLDDARMGNPENRTRELYNAMKMIAETGEGPREQMPSMGCSIKWG